MLRIRIRMIRIIRRIRILIRRIRIIFLWRQKRKSLNQKEDQSLRRERCDVVFAVAASEAT